MRISDVERLVGLSKKNIRFYEEQGLLSPERESQNGYRNYSDDDIARLRQIKLLRRLAVPISEIKSLELGRLSLRECMERQEIFLNGQLRNIEHIKTVCRNIAEDGAAIETIDMEKYEQMMSDLEKGGVRFMKEADTSGRARRRKGAITASLIGIGLFAILIVLIIWAQSVDPIPVAIIAIFIGFCLAVIGGIAAALRARLREIEKGEEDEAFKY